MSKDISAKALTNGVSHGLRRYHVILFTIVVLGGMAAMIFVLNQTLSRSTDTTQEQQIIQTSFDKSTIERLDKLSDSNSNRELVLPENRRNNPFVE